MQINHAAQRRQPVQYLGTRKYDFVKRVILSIFIALYHESETAQRRVGQDIVEQVFRINCDLCMNPVLAPA